MRQAAATHINKETSRMSKVDSVVANHPPSIERLQVAFLCVHLRDCLRAATLRRAPYSTLSCRAVRSATAAPAQSLLALAWLAARVRWLRCSASPLTEKQRSRLVEDEDVADAFDGHEKPSGVQLISCTHLPWFCVCGAHVCLCCLIWGPADIERGGSDFAWFCCVSASHCHGAAAPTGSAVVRLCVRHPFRHVHPPRHC